MENRVYDEKNGLWYEFQEEYYFPCLSLHEEEQKPIGIWGQRHLRYIKQHTRNLSFNLVAKGNLNSYLADIDKQAEEMLSQLVQSMKESECLTEKLKTENQMLWIQRMNNIHSREIEVVNADLIFM
mgnify:FL=1